MSALISINQRNDEAPIAHHQLWWVLPDLIDLPQGLGGALPPETSRSATLL